MGHQDAYDMAKKRLETTDLANLLLAIEIEFSNRNKFKYSSDYVAPVRTS